VAPGPPRSLVFFVDASMATTQAKVQGTAFFPGSSSVTAATDSLFLIQAPVGVETIETAAPPRFALEANRPNPFNPATTIRFGVEKSGPVTLRIYSVKGSLVRRLVGASLPAGLHAVRWDGRDDSGRELSSGIYLYELQSGGRRVARKMSLLK